MIMQFIRILNTLVTEYHKTVVFTYHTLQFHYQFLFEPGTESIINTINRFTKPSENKYPKAEYYFTGLVFRNTFVRIKHGLFLEMPVVCAIPMGLRTDRYTLWPDTFHP